MAPASIGQTPGQRNPNLSMFLRGPKSYGMRKGSRNKVLSIYVKLSLSLILLWLMKPQSRSGRLIAINRKSFRTDSRIDRKISSRLQLTVVEEEAMVTMVGKKEETRMRIIN